MLENKIFHYFYITTNLVNGKTYMGVHSTNNLMDGYIGCGIKRQSDAKLKSKKSRFYGFAHAVEKYGYENFNKKIVKLFKTKEEAYSFESKIITEDVVNCRNNYNLKLGGDIPPNPKGIKRTKEFKKSKRKQILKYMDKLVDISSKYYVFVNLNTNEVFFEKNLANFSRKHSLNKANLRSVSLGRLQKTSDNWWCCKIEDWKGYPVLKKLKKKNHKGKLYHEDGRVISFTNLKDASEKIQADVSHISKVLRGKYKKVKGWYTTPRKCRN